MAIQGSLRPLALVSIGRTGGTRQAVPTFCNRLASSAAPSPRCIRTADRGPAARWSHAAGCSTKGICQRGSSSDVHVSLRCRQARRWSQGRRHRRCRRRAHGERNARGVGILAMSSSRHRTLLFLLRNHGGGEPGGADQLGRARSRCAPAAENARRSARDRSRGRGRERSLAARQASPHEACGTYTSRRCADEAELAPERCSANRRRAKFPLGLERSR